MKAFHYLNATSVDQAVAALKEYKGSAKIIAGGTDLLGVLKDQILPAYPELLVNIKSIPGLAGIEEDQAGLTIGPLVKLADLAASPLVKEKYPLLAQAAEAVGSPQLRNMGTVGGNLAQDTRCWYYRYPHSLGGRISCWRKGDSTCPAAAGDNRYHAILGGRKCFAVCPSDLAPALAVLDARLVVAGPEGTRTIAVADFYHPLGHALAAGEIIAAIQVPKPPANARQCFIKYTLREPIDFAVVSVAALLAVEEGVCTQGSIVLGAVAPGPVRATGAERAIAGKRLEKAVVEEAAAEAVAKAKALSKNGYKIAITKALVRRALTSWN